MMYYGMVGLALATGLYASAVAYADEVKVGVLVPLTGSFAAVGEDMRRGVELFFKQNPKINGRDVRLLIEDTETKPAAALRKADRLANEEGAQVLFGIGSSSEAVAISQSAATLNVPVVLTNAGSVRLTGELCSPWVFRANQNDSMTARGVAKWLQTDEKARTSKWYILGHDFEWGQSSAESFRKVAADLEIKIVGADFAPMDTRDWSTYINKIESSGAQFVWSPIAVGMMPAFIRQARSFGLLDKANIFAVSGILDSQLAAIGEEASGVYTASWATWTLDTPEMKAFNNAYQEEYSTVPGFQAILAYAGAGLLGDAIAKAQSSDAADIAKALVVAKYNAPHGELVMRSFDNQAAAPIYIGRTGRAPQGNQFGAEMAVEVLTTIPPEVTQVPESETGCSGL